ncbi:unnamed protein product [Heterobilharzia americana]|nr:unnamed protein product [Heterobilharzia americana]
MPTSSRLVIYSAFAVTLVYLLNYYRRKRRVRIAFSSSLTEGPGYSYSALQLNSGDTKSSEAYILQDLFTDTVSCDYIFTPMANSLKSVSPLEEELATQKAFCNFTSSHFSQGKVMQPIVSLKNDSGSECERALTPDSNDGFCGISLPPEGFSDPSNDIHEANPEEMDGKILPRVLIPSDMWAEVVDGDIWHETFLIPAYMGGVLIGRLGKNVKELRNMWQAEFSLNTCPGKQDTLVFKLSCPLRHKNDVLRWVAHRFKMRPSKTTIGNPNQLKRQLPLGVPVPVQIRSLYGSKEFFVTIPDDEYSNYLTMQEELEKDYSAASAYRIQLCEPVTSGTVAVVPHSQGFARALIISVVPTWPKTAFYYLLDHGTFGVVQLDKLKKIRAKYMRVPFQAIHVSWAHAFPVYSDIPDVHLLRTFFNSGRVHAFAVRKETCCRASVAFSEPYSQPYSSHGFLDILVSACNSGLYMAVPLLIYPKRQSWLNGSAIPYYPFTYSYIDYRSLVTFAIEEDEGYGIVNQLSLHDQVLNENYINPPKHQSGDQNKPNKSDVTALRSYSNGPRRGQKGSMVVWNSGSRRQNTFRSSMQDNSVSIVSQKENQCTRMSTETTNILKPTSDANNHFTNNHLRKPLSNRNSGVNGSGSTRAVSCNNARGMPVKKRE